MKRKILTLVTALSLLFSTNAFAATNVADTISEVEQPSTQKVYNLKNYRSTIDSFYTGEDKTLLIDVVDCNAEIFILVEGNYSGYIKGYHLNKGDSISLKLTDNFRYSISGNTKSPTWSDAVTLDIRLQ